MKKWYEDSKDVGVLQLCAMFNVHHADFFRLAEGYRHHETKATRKKHIHKHRPTGSKALKKYNRFAWDKKRNEAA